MSSEVGKQVHRMSINNIGASFLNIANSSNNQQQSANQTPDNSRRESYVVQPSNDPYLWQVRKGIAVVLNYGEFMDDHPWCYDEINGEKQKRWKLAPRTGSDDGAIAIFNTLRNLGFTFYTHTGLTNKKYGLRNGQTKETIKLLQEIAGYSKQMAKFDCLVVVVASHGREGKFATYDGFLDIEKDLIGLFDNQNCPSLAGKPKLFFLQACQGRVPAAGTDANADPGAGECLRSILIPTETDILTGYATVPGKTAISSLGTGNWYLEELSRAFDHYSADFDIHGLLSIVGHELALRVAEIEKTTNMKQSTTFISRLRQHVKFSKNISQQVSGGQQPTQ